MQKYFTINSTETKHENVKHSCTFEKPIVKEGTSSKILVSIDPPIPKHFYEMLNDDLNKLVLAPRLIGCSVYPEISKPCYIYMCIPKENGSWLEGPYDILDWGEINLSDE